ncbi:MAG: hypothetical protein GY862_06810, partial [Gammaproteobacteria bacterium]|nr:hypothetical protein [Gammaproteobacteria bacterium]
MSHEKILVANLYNPHEQSKEELISSFVVRHKTFKKLFQEIKEADMVHPEQHYLIEGQRGMGKTTLLLRLNYEIENDPELNSWLVPVVLPEEAHYGIHHLVRLWESVAESLEDRGFAGLAEQMNHAYDENTDYEALCFDLLIQALERRKKKIILFIDNLGEMFQHFSDRESHRLREVLMTCPHLRIIGASAVVLEAFFHYKHAFYEFFRKLSLAGLNKRETRDLLLTLGKAYGSEKIIRKIIETRPGRVDSLRVLTGGVIRTMVLLFEIFLDVEDGDAIKDLEKVLDRVTPLYKHRMDDLTFRQQEIVNAIALNWDALAPDEIARNTRMSLPQVDAILAELEKVYVIRRAATDTKTCFYLLRERFFNIWYLMRLAPKSSHRKVIWLVRFLESWYDGGELAQRAQKQIAAMRAGHYHPKAAFYLTEALAGTARLDMDTEHALISATKKYLLGKDKSLAADLSPSDKMLFDEAVGYYENEEFEKALKLFLAVKNKNEDIHFRLGYCFVKLKEYARAEKYYLMATEKEHAVAMNNLAVLYENEYKDYVKAKKYYLMAVEKEDADAMKSLATLYHTEHKEYDKAEKYYLMAVKKEHARAMNNLAVLYQNEYKDYAKAEKYYLMAVEKEHAGAMNNLALLYKNEYKDYAKAEKYYLMAVEKEHAGAMNGLAWLYFKQKIKKQAALEYAGQAVAADKNKAHKIHTLACIYLWHDRFDEATRTAEGFIHDEKFCKEHEKGLITYFMLLIAKGQYREMTKYFADPESKRKEKLKPLYYALLHYTG